jgi:hypothetical protein
MQSLPRAQTSAQNDEIALLTVPQHYNHFHWMQKDLCWLIEHLLSPNVRIRGCHINVPDMVLFKQGKTHLHAKSDSNGFLIQVKDPKKMKKTELRSLFPTITRERRNKNLDQAELEEIIDCIEEIGFANENKKSFKIQSIEAEMKNANSQNKFQKATKLELETINFDKGEAYKDFNLPVGKTLHGSYYRDIVLVQFYTKDDNENEEAIFNSEKPSDKAKILRPLSENEFLKMMSRRPNDDYWRKVEFIQTCIKSKLGIGEQISVDFFAKISKKIPSRPILFDFRSFQSDQYLMINNKKEYCHKQVVKMCYYISKLYGYEILRMK